MYKFQLNKEYPNFKKFLLDIKQNFISSSKTIHKARNEIKIIKENELSLVVKSFKIPHFLNSFVYAYFRDSKAKKSYKYSLRIADFTPKPIGYIEFYKFTLLKESFFISENFNYDFTIREPLLDDNFPDKEKILKAFARFTYQLHEADIFHKDYSPGNILIKKENDDFIFKVVDINRMGFFKLTTEDRAKNFSKLWASDEELSIIATEYIKEFDTTKNFTQMVCDYSNQNKKVKNFKKRLKGKKVND